MQKVMLRSVAVLLCSVAAFSGNIANAQDAIRQSNLAMLDSCARSIVIRARAHFPAGRITVKVDSSRDAFFLTGPLFRAAYDAQGRSLLSSSTKMDSSDCIAHIELAEIRYSLITAGMLHRTANMRAAIDIRDAGTGRTNWSGVIGDSLTDTIRCDDVMRFESPNIPATIAANPCAEHESVATSLLEPLVLAAASATIVLLLFTVRSQ